MKRKIQVVSLLVLAIPGFAADSASNKVAPKLAAVSKIMPDSSLEVIIQFTQAPGKAEHEFLIKHGGTLRKSLPLINSAAYSLPAKKLDVVCGNTMIERVSLDADVKAAATAALLQLKGEN